MWQKYENVKVEDYLGRMHTCTNHHNIIIPHHAFSIHHHSIPHPSRSPSIKSQITRLHHPSRTHTKLVQFVLSCHKQSYFHLFTFITNIIFSYTFKYCHSKLKKATSTMDKSALGKHTPKSETRYVVKEDARGTKYYSDGSVETKSGRRFKTRK